MPRLPAGLGVGPAQMPTIDRFISEEFVHGVFLTHLRPEQVSGELMRGLGANPDVGAYPPALCRRLLQRRHHIRSGGSVAHHRSCRWGEIRLIDFGVALLLDNHPQGLTFEDAWNAARTDPMFRLFRQMTGGEDDAALGRFVADYGRRLAGQTVAQIQERGLAYRRGRGVDDRRPVWRGGSRCPARRIG